LFYRVKISYLIRGITLEINVGSEMNEVNTIAIFKSEWKLF